MTKRLITLLLLVFSLAAGRTAWASARFEIPNDVQKLMPGEATGLVAISSANELADRYVAILAEVGEDESASREGVLSLLESVLPGFTSEVDLDQPLFAVAGLPNLMGGGQPPFMLIVPLQDGAAKADTFAIAHGLENLYREGNYLAIASDPVLTPVAGIPELATHLPAGTLSATLDLADLVTNFRVFIEMGLSGIPIKDETADPPVTEGMSADEAAAVKTLVSQALDSVTRLDVSLGHDGDLLTMHTGLGIAPGSVLDPGPQPDFGKAQALTAALPRDTDFLQVIALDQTRVFAVFRDYYLLTMKSTLSDMDAEHAEKFDAWVEDYMNNMDLWANPMAAALSLGDDGMAVHMVMESADAKSARDRISQTLGDMADLDIGYNLTRAKDRKVAGVKFQVWDVDIDLEQFESVMPDHDGPAMSGTDRMQAEQLISILQRVMPTVYLGAKGDKLFMAADKNTDQLASMVEKAGRKGSPVPAVAAIAAKAGPDCQQVITGDLLAIINWVTDMLSDMTAEQHAVITDNPIPFQADFIIEGSDFGFDMGMDLPSLGNLVRAAKEMEAMTEDEAVEAETETTDEQK